MKKILLCTLVALVSVSFPTPGMCDEKPIPYEKLPNAIQQFTTKHFSETTFCHAEKDSDEYEVWLTDGTELSFTRSGEWEKVKSKQAVIPESIMALIPKSIPDYFSKNYPDKHIYQIKVERNGYEVVLRDTPDWEFKFNKAGAFLRIDD